MQAEMGIKVRFYRGAWWIFINHQGRRRSKKVGDQQTAIRVAKEIRERLARGDFHLAAAESLDITFQKYSEEWLVQARLNLKASTVSVFSRKGP